MASSPSLKDNRAYLFLARGVEENMTPDPDEHELVEVVRMPVEELLELRTLRQDSQFQWGCGHHARPGAAEGRLVSEGPPQYSILDLATADEETIRQAANLLVEGFRDNWPGAWPTEEEALEEVREALREGRICRAALGEDGTLLGWIGGMPAYEGKVWELHPLVVRPDFQT